MDLLGRFVRKFLWAPQEATYKKVEVKACRKYDTSHRDLIPLEALLMNFVEKEAKQSSRLKIPSYKYTLPSKESKDSFECAIEKLGFQLDYKDTMTEEDALELLSGNIASVWFEKNWNKQTENPEDIAILSVSAGVFVTSNTFYCLSPHPLKGKTMKAHYDKFGKLSMISIACEKGYSLEVPVEAIQNYTTVHIDGSDVLWYLHLSHPPLIYISKTVELNDRKRTNESPGMGTEVWGNVESICINVSKKHTPYIHRFAEDLCRIRLCFVDNIGGGTENEIREYLHQMKAPYHDFVHNDFDLTYSIKAFSSRGLKAHSISPTLLNDITVNKTDRKIVMANLHKLTKNLDGQNCSFLVDTIQLFKTSSRPFHNNRKNFVRSARITPTRVLFDDLVNVPNCRLIEHFSPEFMLRISLVDDNEQPLNHINNIQVEEVYDNWICMKLKSLQVCPKVTYEFLGGSNSQLREHGCYMYAPDYRGNTADSVREWVGELDRIRCVATYIARLGLAFSKVNSTLPISPAVIKYIPDITGGSDPRGQPYVFTDGVGKISHQLLAKVARASHHLPSAIQIRLGGCKGVVALDPLLHGDQLMIRDSMKKFNSDHYELGIQSKSKKNVLRLNREVITILGQLGVNSGVFLELQEDDFCKTFRAFFEQSCAWQELQGLEIVGPKSKINPLSDNLCRKLVWGKLKNKIDNLHRAKISLPLDEGRNMMGVADETQTLKYGQVFVQCDINNKGYKPLQCTVVVTKMPCKHPGDVRKFQAVDVSGLSHMKDVIVFPTTGKRPHPDEMSGSDLDGDSYFVSWKKVLIFDKPNSEPMDFPSSKKQEIQGPVTVDHMVEYMKSSILNDKLGVISNMHMKHADYQKDGIFSEICLELCEVCSKTVDGAKTGYIPNIKPEYKVPKVPDFFGGDGQVYESKRALGKLYRHSKRMEELCKMIPSEYLRDTVSQGIPQKCLRVFEHFSREMYSIKRKYKIGDDIDVLANILPVKRNFDDTKALKADLKALCKNIRSQLNGLDSDRSATDGFIELSKGLHSVIGQAFCHLCTSCDIMVQMDGVKDFSADDYQRLKTEFPENIERLDKCDLINEERSHIAQNDWCLAAAAFLSVKCDCDQSFKLAMERLIILGRKLNLFGKLEEKNISLFTLGINWIKGNTEVSQAYLKLQEYGLSTEAGRRFLQMVVLVCIHICLSPYSNHKMQKTLQQVIIRN